MAQTFEQKYGMLTPEFQQELLQLLNSETQKEFLHELITEKFDSFRLFSMLFETEVTLGLNSVEVFDYLANSAKIGVYKFVDVLYCLKAMEHRSKFNWLQVYGKEEGYKEFQHCRRELAKIIRPLEMEKRDWCMNKIAAMQTIKHPNLPKINRSNSIPLATA